MLRLVKPVHLVDEEDGLASATCLMKLGALDGRSNFLYPIEHRRQRFEMVIAGSGDNLSERRLAYTGRPPENHRVRKLVLYRFKNGLTRAKQVFLPDEFS